MELRIGIQHAPRELSFETDQTAEAIEKLVENAFAKGLPVVKFTDEKNRTYLVQTATILYVEAGSDQARRVGFIA